MKKGLLILLTAGILMSGCGTNEAAGAYTGSMFGDVLGSAIGGIVGGWRGHEVGSLIGTMGGAIVGAAVGAQQDRVQEQRARERAAARSQRLPRHRSNDATMGQAAPDDYSFDPVTADQSGFDPEMRGDDRITFSPGNDTTYTAPMSPAHYRADGPTIVIRNAGVFETEHDGVLTRGESCSVVFEITNTSSQPVFDIFPLVEELTGNRHIHISPNLRVESIGPRQTIRYSASLYADTGLRNGQVQVRVGVAQGNSRISSQNREFTVPTAKRASRR